MNDLRTVRKEKRLSQQNVAETIGLRQSTLAEIESGLRAPRRQTIQKIESLFGAEVNWRRTLSGEDHSHIMYKMVELINEQEEGVQERIQYCRQCLEIIENTLKN